MLILSSTVMGTPGQNAIVTRQSRTQSYAGESAFVLGIRGQISMDEPHFCKSC